MKIQSTATAHPRAVRSPADAIDGAPIPLSGPTDRVPPTRIDARVSMAFDPDRADARIVRDLRAEILAKISDQPRPRPWSIALVALDAGSDVGVIAANLAVSFALLERRTLIIEADFEAAAQAELFCLDAEVGVVEVFQHAEQIDRAVYPTAIPNLEVVPLGNSAGVNTIDAVARRSIVETFDLLLRHSNIVVIPTSGLSTGSLATALVDVDIVVPVARRGLTKMRDLKGFVTMAEAQGINACGIVLSN